MATTSAITQPQPSYAQQLAAIDQLRDQALATGNAALLRQADQLQSQLQQRSAHGNSAVRR